MPFPGAVPVLLVTGFLGAGKTTLVRHLLGTPEGARSAVIVNEFADLGLDGRLLAGAGAGVTELPNGCFCCRSRGDLAAALTELFAGRRAGRIADFDRVVVETSGLADPGAVLLALAGDEELRHLFVVQAIVTVVDAVHGRATLETYEEARRQLALAEVVALTKADLAGADEVAALRASIAEANPEAVVLDAPFGRVPAAELLDRPWLVRPRAPRLRPAAHRGGLAHHALVRAVAWRWEPFALAMETLAALRGPDLLRVKGLVRVAGRDGPVVYHRVRHLAHPPLELSAWPDGPRETNLVFITRRIPGQEIEALIDAVLGVAPAA